MVRLAALSRPDADDDAATRPPTIRVRGVRDPVETNAPSAQTVGTIDDFIAARVADRLNLPAVAPLPPSATPTPAVAASQPESAGIIDSASPPATPTPRHQAGPPEPGRLVLPTGGTVHQPLTGPSIASSDPPRTPRSPTSLPDSTDSPGPLAPAPTITDMAVAPLSGAALTVANRVFTADEILRPIWGELSRLATRYSGDEHRRQAIDRIANRLRGEVAEHLVHQESERSMTDEAREAVDAALKDLMQERANTMFGGSERKMRQAWAHEGLDPDKEMAKARRQLLVQAYLREKFTPQVHVVRSEAFAYYEKHIDEFTAEPRIRLKLVEIQPTYPAGGEVTQADRLTAVAKARDRARQVREQVRTGAITFEAAADKFADGRSANGGDLGLVRKGSLRARAVEAAAFALPVGQLSDVIEDSAGGNPVFYLALVTESQPLKVTPFTEAVNTIMPKLERLKFNDQSAAYMSKLYRQAGVDDTAVMKFLDDAYRVVPKPQGP